MKQRKILWMLITALLLFCTACGGKTEKKKALTGEDAPEKVIEAANKQYGKEKKRGMETVSTHTFTDGSSETEEMTSAFDAEKEIQQTVYEWGGGSLQKYDVKEEDSCYTYALNPETNAWLRYEQEPEEGMLTAYEYLEEGKAFDFSEACGYTNVSYSNEGEEKIDGVSAVKIRVTGEEKAAAEETNGITREEILRDCELTEEEIGYIDGLSEALDRYLEAMDMAADVRPARYEIFLWVDADTHRPLKSEETATFENVSDIQPAEAMKEFEENVWKAYQVKSDLEEGFSLAEALENVKNREAEILDEIAAEREMMAGESEEDSEDSMALKESFSVCEYVYGQDCAQIGELPEHYTEITQEEYRNGEY